jgi:hypothetical protein
MKDLILITAHIPDKKREDLLRNMVNKLVGSDYDIMICTHTPIPIDICNNVDYVIYEKRNELITDIKNKYNLYYFTDYFFVTSTEVAEFNHFIPIFRSLKLGLKIAKEMKYKKVHYFEYDTDFHHLNELEINSKLIDEYCSVYYKTQIDIGHPNSPISFNIEKIDDNWFEFDYEELYNTLNNLNTKKAEEHEFNLLSKNHKNYIKEESDLISFGVLKGLNNMSNKFPWNVFCVNKNNKLLFFGDNSTNEICKIQVIVNDVDLHNIEINPNTWSLKELIDYDHVKQVTMLVNGFLRANYDFNKIDKEVFKDKNKIIEK